MVDGILESMYCQQERSPLLGCQEQGQDLTTRGNKRVSDSLLGMVAKECIRVITRVKHNSVTEILRCP